MKRPALFLALTMAVLLPPAASAQDSNDKSDKTFCLDRVDNAECADLLTHHKEMASLQRK